QEVLPVDPAPVLLEESADSLLVEDPALERAPREDRLLEESRQGAAEPVVERDAEAHFLPVEDRVREPRREGSLEDRLRRRPVHLETRRERRDELGELVVEERSARLEG